VVLIAVTAAAHAQPSPELTKEFQAGVDAYRLGKFDEARAHLEAAKKMDPKLPGPNRFLAAVAQAQQRWQDCIDAARTAIELNPRSAEIADTRKVHDECRTSAGRQPYREELGDSAALAVQTNAIGATVKVGGLNYGGTPLAPRPITAGILEIDLEKPGYLPKHLQVNALPGIVTDVIVDLETDPNAEVNTGLGEIKPLAKIGKLVVPGEYTEVTVDGKVMTPRNGELELESGTRVIEISKPGHDPWRRRVRINVSQKTPVTPMFVETSARETKEKIGMAFLGGGLAIVGFGFYAALKSSDYSADAREIDRLESGLPPAGKFTRHDFDVATDNAKKWRLISGVSVGVGLAAVGAGAVFFFLGGKERADVPPPYALAPVNGGAMIVRGVSW
jgi:tetratricopeptide (TPR) repeat protein